MIDRSKVLATFVVLASVTSLPAAVAAEAEPVTPAPAAPPPAATTAAPAPAASDAAPTPAAVELAEDPAQEPEGAKSDAADEAPPPPSSATAVALAEPPAPTVAERPNQNSVDDGQMGSHQTHFALGIGWRQAFVKSTGLDPFSDDDAVPQLSISAGRTVLAAGKLSLVGLLLWDWGSLESTARGAKTTLVLNRLTLGVEGRYHLFRRLYLFGRVAPGALHSEAELEDASLGVNRAASAWVFATDLSGGAAFEFAGDARGASTRPRAWVGVDGGYGWAGSSTLDLEPTHPEQAPVRPQPLSFGDLSVSGPFVRLTATGTY